MCGGSVALAVDLDSYAGPSRAPKVASAMRVYGDEATANAATPVAGLETAEEPEEPEKWISGSVVGSWSDGHIQSGDVWKLDQTFLTVQKSANTDLPFDYGYHVDAIFGTNNAQSYGDGGFDGKWGISGDGYAASIYQGYVEFSVGKLTGKFGKFGTLLGYESIDTASGDFYTHTHMYDNEPLTHSGGLFTWAPTDAFNVSVGLVDGADNSFQNYKGDTGFLFGASLKLSDRLSVAYASELNQVHSGSGEDRVAQSGGYYDLGGESIGDQNEYLQTVTVNLDLTDKLSYAFVTNYGTMEDRATRTHRYGQYGFANYLTYAVSDQLSSAVRYEYYLAKLYGSQKAEGNYHDVSYALKYKPTENVFIMPEVRYDWEDNAGDKDDGVTGAVACGFVF